MLLIESLMVTGLPAAAVKWLIELLQLRIAAGGWLGRLVGQAWALSELLTTTLSSLLPAASC